MFFLLTSFRFCQPLKNDGNGELRFGMVLNDFLYKRNSKECKPSPLVIHIRGKLMLRKKGFMVLHNGVICF